jgi:hypothetical protein
MQATKVREKIAAVVALLLIFIMFVAMAVVFEWNIPGVRTIAEFLNIR